MTQLEQIRRKHLRESISVIERHRVGPDLFARCGCKFVPWQDKMVSGAGLVQECDLAGRLALNNGLQQWSVHVGVARLDAEEQLTSLIRQLMPRKR